MVPTYEIKQGAVLSLAVQLQQDDGTPVDITGANLQSQIRDTSNNLVATPTLTITGATEGQFSYLATSDTTWPIAKLRCDIYIMLDAVPFYTDTFLIGVSAPVTVVGN